MKVSQYVKSYIRDHDGPEVQVFEFGQQFANDEYRYQRDRWLTEFYDVLHQYRKQAAGEYRAVIDLSRVRTIEGYNLPVMGQIVRYISQMQRSHPPYFISIYYESPAANLYETTDRYEPTSTWGKLGKLLGQGLSVVGALNEMSQLQKDADHNDWIELHYKFEGAVAWVRAQSGPNLNQLPRTSSSG